MREICICRSSAIIKNQDEKKTSHHRSVYKVKGGNDESNGKPQLFGTSTYVY